MTGIFATARRGFDATDAEYVMTQLGRDIPLAAIARMMGRNVGDVQAIATARASGLQALERLLAPAKLSLPRPPKPKAVKAPRPTTIAHLPTPLRPPPENTMAACVWWAAARHGVSFADVLGRNPTRRACHARQEAMWEAYQILKADGSRKYGRPHIGLYFHRDRQTVWHAFRAHVGRSAKLSGQARAA